MNKSDLYKLLEAADNADGDVYAPSALTDEVYFELKQKIELVKQEVESLTGREMFFDGRQDTSCIEELGIFNRKGPLGRPSESEFIIKFSNFFNFVALIDNPKFEWINEHIEEIIKILESHGFINIPEEVLLSEYKGKYRDLLDAPTWEHRFFM